MSTDTSIELVERLFIPRECWGWEFVAPAPLAKSPEADSPPAWQEPEPPDVNELESGIATAKKKLPKRLGIAAVLFLLAALGSPAAGAVVLVAGATMAYVVPVLLPAQKIKSLRAQTRAARDADYAQYERARQQWQWRMDTHDEQERARQADALLWHPIHPQASPSRIDVFGGTGDGWASLLATLGSSLIESGYAITVLDFTEQYIAGGLAAFVSAHGGRVTDTDLPNDTARFDVLAHLAADELAELLAAAVHTMRPADAPVDLRAVDTELLESVIGSLDEPATFARVVAGLEVLRRTYDVTAAGPLSTGELTRLTAHVDAIGQNERAGQELQFLINELGLLAKDDFAGEPGGEAARRTNLWQAAELAVITTTHPQDRRKAILDRVVFHRLLHDMRHQRGVDADGVLVVAGADSMGLEGLEALTRQCRRDGVRLVLLLERLRGEMEQLLGSSDSAAVLMRLGNAKDAASAAEFIGRGHKVVLSQVTAQVGKTFTTGTAASRGITDGTSESDSTSTSTSRSVSHNVGRSGTGRHAQGLTRSRGLSVSTSKSVSKSRSVTTSRSESWQNTVNESAADSTTDGTTHSRVYEFTVEPTTIQSLPPTAFVMIENPPSGRRVVVGDCNPGITLLDRVAPAALPA
jgi:hypothetical protein